MRKTTWLLAGFPGRPKRGVFFQKPNKGGEPGRILTRQNLMSPSSSIIFRTRSQSPIETPPDVNIMSHSSAALSSWTRKLSIESDTELYRIGLCPFIITRDANPKELDSKISVSPNSPPGKRNSSPVEIIPIVNFLNTST